MAVCTSARPQNVESHEPILMNEEIPGSLQCVVGLDMDFETGAETIIGQRAPDQDEVAAWTL